MSGEYMGWTNYCTYLYKEWIAEDKDAYIHWEKRTQELKVSDLAIVLEHEIRKAIKDELPEGSCLTSLLNHVIESIDYGQIAKHLKETWEGE